MKTRSEAGFSIVELVIVILVSGLLLAFAMPSLRGYSERHLLAAAKQNLVGQLRLARQNAIVTGTTQVFHATENGVGNQYHLHNGPAPGPVWDLPGRITFVTGPGTQWRFRMTKEGRCLDSGHIVIQDSKGRRDTITVLASGLVLAP